MSRILKTTLATLLILTLATITGCYETQGPRPQDDVAPKGDEPNVQLSD